MRTPDYAQVLAGERRLDSKIGIVLSDPLARLSPPVGDG